MVCFCPSRSQWFNPGRLLGLIKLCAPLSAGTSTPSFGQSAAAGPIPFGSPGTPVQGFNAVPFGRSLMLFFDRGGYTRAQLSPKQPRLFRPCCECFSTALHSKLKGINEQ